MEHLGGWDTVRNSLVLFFKCNTLKSFLGISLPVQWLRLCLPMEGGVGVIICQGVKIPHTSQPKNENIKQKQYCNKFNKYFKNGPHFKKICKKVFCIWFWIAMVFAVMLSLQHAVEPTCTGSSELILPISSKPEFYDITLVAWNWPW